MEVMLDAKRGACGSLAVRLWVAPLGLALGLRPTRYRDYDEPFVRWIDERGEPLLTAGERLERERARADEAFARVKELEALLRGGRE
jgi:hypothetical protein